MKALPFLTLALCVVFLGVQRASLSSQAKAVTTLKTRVEEARTAGAPGRSGGRGPHGAAKSGRDHREAGSTLPQSVQDLDLRELAETFMASERGGVPNLKAMIKVRSLLLEATPEELKDLIARTTELDVPDRVKEALIGEFIGGLADTDPEAALEIAFSSDYLDLDRQRWRFRQSFAKWLKDDPRTAVAWFDREIAQGTFEPKSLDGEAHARFEFESAVINSFLDHDPGLARERLLTLPEQDRRRLLNSGHLFRINADNALAHAELVRATLPVEERARVLAQASANYLGERDYEALTEYAERINATPGERASIVTAAVERRFERFGWQNKVPTTEDLAELHAYLQEELPDQAGHLTGESLARYGNTNDNYERAVAVLTELQRTTPNDEILVGFLNGPHSLSEHQAARRALAEQISDPVRRQEVLDSIDRPQP